MRIVITGSESFIGKELIKQCEYNNIGVIGIDLAHGLDIRSKNIINEFPQKVDAIVHLAAIANAGQCQENVLSCFDVNILGTLNLIDICLKKNVKKFIFASSEWVYGETKSGDIKTEDSIISFHNVNNEYALSKLISEFNLKQQFVKGFCPITILRFSIVYGPRKNNWSAVESLLNSVKMCNTVTVGSLRTARCFIHVKDVASSIISALCNNKPGYEIYNVSGNNLINLGEIIRLSSELLRKTVKIIETDSENYNIRNISNIKIKNKLSWQPEINMRLGLNSLIEI